MYRKWKSNCIIKLQIFVVSYHSVHWSLYSNIRNIIHEKCKVMLVEKASRPLLESVKASLARTSRIGGEATTERQIGVVPGTMGLKTWASTAPRMVGECMSTGHSVRGHQARLTRRRIGPQSAGHMHPREAALDLAT